MIKQTKVKQIVIRLDKQSYDKISKQAGIEHRGLGDFVRHVALCYIENLEEKGDEQP